MAMVLLKDLTPKKETWIITVKVLRKWKVHRRAPPFTPWKLSMMLLDDEGTRIEGYTNLNILMDRYRTFPVEGETYQVENFKVVGNRDEYSFTSNPFKLEFNPSTIFRPMETQINANEYNFVPIKNISDRAAHNTELIDILGLLRAFGQLEEQRRDYDGTVRLNFALADLEDNTANVVLYGDVAEETFRNKHANMKPPIVVLARFVKIKERGGFAGLTNASEATQVVFNPDMPEAAALLQGNPTATQAFSQVGIPEPETMSPESMLLYPRRFTIAQIKNMDPPNDVVTKATIEMVETFPNWKYEGCTCNSKLTLLENNKFTCKKCPGEITITEPKYAVHYKISDSTDQCSIVFFNKEAVQLYGKTALELQQKLQRKKREGSFPSKLSKIIGMEMVLLLRMKGYNKTYPQSSMAVGQFSADPELLEKFTYSSESSPSQIPQETTIDGGSSQTSIDSSHLSFVPHTYTSLDSGSSRAQATDNSPSKRKEKTQDLSDSTHAMGLEHASPPQTRSKRSSTSAKKEKLS